MSSTASKARIKKIENINPKIKRLMPSKNESETTEDSLNTVSKYKRYNLRSYSPSKVPIQLKSKIGKSLNTDFEILKNESSKKESKKLKITDGLDVKESNSSKTGPFLPSSKSYKSKKTIFIKNQTPKYVPPLVTKEDNKCDGSDTSDFDVTNAVLPYKSILKRTPANKSTKNSHLVTLNEKDIIKDRIYGTTFLKQKKVKFQIMSCNNLEVISYGNTDSINLSDSIKKCDEFNISNEKDINSAEVAFSGTNSENKNDESTAVHLESENVVNLLELDICSAESFQNQTEEYEIQAVSAVPSLSHERKNLYSQSPKNKIKNSFKTSPKLILPSQNFIKMPDVEIKTQAENVSQTTKTESKNSCEISPKFELPRQNFGKTSDADRRSQTENILNEHQSFDKKLGDTKINNSTREKIENLKIFIDVDALETLSKNKKIQEEITESKLDNQNFSHADQHDVFNNAEERILINKGENCYENKTCFDKKKTRSIITQTLSSSMPRCSPHHLEDQMQTKHQATVQKEVEDKIKILTSKFLQEIQKERKYTKKNFFKTRRAQDCNIMQSECGVAETKVTGGKDVFIKSLKEKDTFLMRTPNFPHAEEYSTPQKNCLFRQKPNLNLNNSNKSPGISKIPRFMQNLNKDFSPLSKTGITASKMKKVIGDKNVQNQNELNCLYNFENEQNKPTRLKQSLITTYLSKKRELNNLFEEMLTESDCSKVSTSQGYDQENNVMIAGNEDHFDTNTGILNDERDDKLKLVDNMVSLGKYNDDFKNNEEYTVFDRKNRKDPVEEMKKSNQELYREVEIMKNEENDQRNTESCLESCIKEKKKKIVSKERQNRTRISIIMIVFFLSALLYALSFMMLEKIVH